MELLRYYMPTLREVPQEAEIPSHRLLLRAGMIRRQASGIYAFLPLGYRVLKKIEQIVREEMDRAGSQELLMSIVQPREIWEESGRWKTFGPEMFKLKDRNEREFCLGPTAEEYFTDMIKGEITSYKQLPLNLYQIQWKYRDEKRPRFGINRSREFLMKDAYSFDANHDGLEKSYQIMWDAYVRVFDRLHIDYRVVLGDSGAMGGNRSHEFTALSEIGEGVIVYCPSCDYAATDEKAGMQKPEIAKEEALPMEEVSTPGATTIEDLTNFLGMAKNRMMKAVCLTVQEEPVLVFVPGDRELNMAKLVAFLKVPEHEIAMMDDATIRRITGAEPGFTGPVNLKEEVRIIVDESLTKRVNLLCGANKTDAHLKNVNYGSDFTGEIANDLWMAKEGDLCPECGEKLEFARGIEVGNIFQLGTKYSASMGALFQDESGKTQPFVMGSYGIGISRTVSAIVEQNHDEKGIIWPLVCCPFHVIISVMKETDEDQISLAKEMEQTLEENGVEVLLDNRKERAGVKFNDRDLLGIPLRITVGKKAKERIVEFSTRREMENMEWEAQKCIEHVLSVMKEV